MAKHPNTRRLRTALNYTVAELARALDVTEVTVRNWIELGLPALTNQRPTLIMGFAAKEFLDARKQAGRFKLADDELTCFTCKAPRRAFEGMVDLIAIPGKPIRIQGFCERCEGNCSRTISREQIPKFQLHFDIAANSAGAA